MCAPFEGGNDTPDGGRYDANLQGDAEGLDSARDASDADAQLPSHDGTLRVFVSATTLTGDMNASASAPSNPYDRADEVCKKEAYSLSARRDTAWVSYLGGASGPSPVAPDARIRQALQRVTGVYRWVNTRGALVFSSDAFTTIRNDAGKVDPPFFRVDGQPNTAESGGFPVAWTGALTLGSVSTPSGNDCGGWQRNTADVQGALGATGSIDGDGKRWRRADLEGPCDRRFPIYCFEVPVATP
jgi:hypothetical protein